MEPSGTNVLLLVRRYHSNTEMTVLFETSENAKHEVAMTSVLKN